MEETVDATKCLEELSRAGYDMIQLGFLGVRREKGRFVCFGNNFVEPLTLSDNPTKMLKVENLYSL